MKKAEIRKYMLAHRRDLTEAEVETRSLQIADLFFQNFPLKGTETIHVFLPILKNREINTWLIIHKIWRECPGCKIAVPVTKPKATNLEHFLLTPQTELTESNWGITEPVNAQPIAETEIDIVLLPLLAFDLKGHRVGYGKGYYDRFLQKCRPDLLKIGVSLLAPLPEIKGIHDGDKALDFCLTPEKQYQFR